MRVLDVILNYKHGKSITMHLNIDSIGIWYFNERTNAFVIKNKNNDDLLNINIIDSDEIKIAKAYADGYLLSYFLDINETNPSIIFNNCD